MYTYIAHLSNQIHLPGIVVTHIHIRVTRLQISREEMNLHQMYFLRKHIQLGLSMALILCERRIPIHAHTIPRTSISYKLLC